jgi:hypothetical protein
MAPKSSKRGGSRKLSLKKSTVRDLKAPGGSAKAVKGGARKVSIASPACLSLGITCPRGV